ncbi:hypothetical protein AAG570_012641 [Ranatra chinensis]|uniref:beta-N-acetylhexosaminidase n=1 Tax=Ranatra chinensis TaxID=642074 RepID=A0ABD0YT55_9HEMI
MINDSQVSDGPRFPHRGLLIDTSRHYLPKPIIQKMLTAMESNKMNVLHWHIVDDESFPYSSKLYPSLSAQGAYNSGGFVYTDNDIKEIVEFARLRGIRVVPEFDTPGHTRSWGEGIPNLLTRCYTGSAPNGQLGPINPTDENNYIILKRLFGEIIQLFPDSYLHLGGDEVEHTCWSSNPNIRDFMKTHNMTQISDLEDLHMRRMFDIVNELNTSSVVWQEAFTRGVKLPKSTLVQVWLGKASNLLKMVTSAGYRALLSSCWYLDHFGNDLYGGGGDWKKFYRCDPLDFPGTEDQKRLVLGGEACMWGEYVDETNVLQRVWPRASAAAEKLWSDPGQDMDHVASRLEEHVCRMRRRGIPAQPPNGPSFCA